MGSITRTIANNLTTDLGGAGGINFKNIIINGDMSIAQRGTSVSGKVQGGYFTIDRFAFLTVTGSNAEFTLSQDTDAPTGQGFVKSYKVDCTTAHTVTGSNQIAIRQFVEGQNLQYLKKGTSSAESTTLSFWVKSNKTGTYIAELYDTDNTRQISQAYTIDSASTWEKKTITFAGDTTGTFDNDNGGSLIVVFWLAAGTDFTSGTLNTSWNSVTNSNRAVGQVNIADSTSNDFWITGVQLEAGTTASDFEFLPYDVNLNRCYRYFELETTASGGIITVSQAYSTSASLGYKQYKVIKRAAPTISYTGTAISLKADTTSGGGTLAFDQISVDNCRANITSATGLVAGNASSIYANGTEIKISYSAEL